jgi:hypothetical protein
MSIIEVRKLAWIRDKSVPQGQRALGRFDCDCGATIADVEHTSAIDYTCSGCGMVLDGTGWIKKAGDINSPDAVEARRQMLSGIWGFGR